MDLRNAVLTAPAGEDILAVTRIGDSEGLAEVVVREGRRAATVTGDWVATEPSLAPDGRRLVVVRADGGYESSGPESTTLWVLGVDGSEPRRLTEGPWDDEPHWSPDGTAIAYSTTGPGSRGIMVVPAEGGKPRALLPDGQTGDRAPAWSPDARRIAWIRGGGAGSRRSSVWVADADGDGARQVTSAVVFDGHNLDWHPDGRSLLVSTYSGGGGGVFLVDVASGDMRLIADPSLFGTWSADGTAVYYLVLDDDSQGSPWRLAQGRIVDGRLEVERFVDGIEEFYFPYPYLGLAVRRCAAAG